ncbi:MAG TPA: polymer-forming cytoskeletal protein [Nitrospiraceae bacterium]|nr:polymer-forming cytoskeletal protein [Nitrospiraceae bacterium]HBU05321.1 polymer-forming cytoskeletal protein [Nitrospiraceae bacterium]
MFSMFSKNTEKLESFIGINSNFKGDIKTQGTLRVDGTVEGNIETDWLILGETSHLKGNAVSKGIIVGGRVDGNLTAREIIEIKTKGQVTGELATSKLSIAEGAMFDGRSSMIREESNVIELQAKEKAS